MNFPGIWKGTNRGAVTGRRLEPVVQVGTAGDISGFPQVVDMHNNVAVSSLRHEIRLKFN
jgi:hypothetical protein